MLRVVIPPPNAEPSRQRAPRQGTPQMPGWMLTLIWVVLLIFCAVMLVVGPALAFSYGRWCAEVLGWA